MKVFLVPPVHIFLLGHEQVQLLLHMLQEYSVDSPLFLLSLPDLALELLLSLIQGLKLLLVDSFEGHDC